MRRIEPREHVSDAALASGDLNAWKQILGFPYEPAPTYQPNQTADTLLEAEEAAEVDDEKLKALVTKISAPTYQPKEMKMKVELFDFTGNETSDPADYAATRLIFTKSTRLNMSPGLLAEIRGWPYDRKIEELAYMANTVPSSWEFCDYSFIITGVTRAFTHQLVRTRTASYAQQAMRVQNMSDGPGWEYATGPTIAADANMMGFYKNGMDAIADRYQSLIAAGAAVQDARGLLPTNILTNICMKINMRNFIDLVKKRSSARVQDEYRSVIEAMKAEVLRVHPWTEIFMNRTADVAARELQEMIAQVSGCDSGTALDAFKTDMIKKLDRIRAEM